MPNPTRWPWSRPRPPKRAGPDPSLEPTDDGGRWGPARPVSRWEEGVPVVLEYVGGGYLRLPEVGASPASVAHTLSAWLER
jgi:hypothetical protein